MKRTSINLLCILIMAALAMSVIMPVYYIGYSFGVGFAHGVEHADTGLRPDQPASTAYDLAFNPSFDLMMAPADSVRTADGKAYPLILERASVMIPDREMNGTASVISTIIGIIDFIIGLGVLVTFVVFVVNINKCHIFESKNVRLLRAMGFLLLSVALLRVAQGIIDDRLLAWQGFAIDGYSVSTYWAIPWSPILLGLLSLLMAQIWAQGIAFKEDQELTI